MSWAFVTPDALDALGRSMHALLDRAVRLDADDPGALDALQRAREAVDEAARALARHGVRGPGLRVGREGEPADARRYWVQGPLIGPHHPMSPELEIRFEDGVTQGEVRFGPAYEGPPGCVHGGYVAWFFDQILGYQNVMTEHRGMTASLEIKYRRPTPLDATLRFEARTVESRGRTTRTAGTLCAGEAVTAEAEGLFVRPREGFSLG